MAMDMRARPHEILNLIIKDIKFCRAENGIQYAEVSIKFGKLIPMIFILSKFGINVLIH
jgi:hypothetical protein